MSEEPYHSTSQRIPSCLLNEIFIDNSILYHVHCGRHRLVTRRNAMTRVVSTCIPMIVGIVGSDVPAGLE